MVWFKVDDKLHSHPKAEAASLAALGLWTVAGAWCGDHLTDGNVPEHVARKLSRGAVELADELVSAGLWRRTRTGYRFHEWAVDSATGTGRNPSKKEVIEKRQKRADAGRKGGLASGKTRSKRSSKTEANASAGASPSVEPPTRPLALTELRGSGVAPQPPPDPDNPNPQPPERDERDWLWRPDEDPAITRERNKRGAAAIRALTRSTDKDDPSRDERLTRLGIDPTTELLQIVPPSLMIVQSRGRLYGQPPGKHTQLDPDDDQEEAS